MNEWTMDTYLVAAEIAESRGWDRAAHEAALKSRDEDEVAITHPINYLSEEEWEELYP